MSSSRNEQSTKIVVDSIHGDIRLTDQQWRVVDTPSFQRLRHLKQLGMGHVTYPNATHTRFAHSLGVLHIMSKVLKIAKNIDLSSEEEENLCLAALLHDIGHYPYSHLMEGVDAVKLIEDQVDGVSSSKELHVARSAYPGHQKVGELIVTNQEDLVSAICTGSA
jgi:hypothetical protein